MGGFGGVTFPTLIIVSILCVGRHGSELGCKLGYGCEFVSTTTTMSASEVSKLNFRNGGLI